MNNTLQSIYEILYARYGDLQWWPAKTVYEVMVGAVLTQNTAWTNVEKALANFTANPDDCNNLTPEFVLSADIAELVDIIRPAGFFNQKAVYLKTMTEWFAKYNFDVPTVQKHSLEKMRRELLAVKGVGKETADSILLYAFEFPTFVVDAYTVRLFERYSIDIGKNYDTVKAYCEDNLPRDVFLYNNFHALIVINGKHHCRKKTICRNCPLEDRCKRDTLTQK
ncbi:MAG: endonuclease III domain-containing protein [Oscillospiraceae bacterium]|nr:endonuclease III domain-containing protein [Oscillospiraceae bacterium]